MGARAKPKPPRTMEIGMACGGSTLTFAATHRDLKHSSSRQHVAIDGFQLAGNDHVGRLSLEAAGLSDYCFEPIPISR